MVFLDLLVVLLALVGTVFLSLFTYFKNPKSATNKLFFWFAGSIAVYNFINYLTLHQLTDEATLFWIRTVMLVALFINFFLFLLVSTFPQPRLGIKKGIFWAGLTFTLFLLPLMYTGLIFKAVKPSTTQPIPGPAMPLFLLHTIFFIGGALVNLVKKFKKARGIEKIQMKLFLMGLVMMFVMIMVTNLIFVVFLKTTAYVGLLPVYTLVFVGFIAYAIIKHRFLDIRLIVARTVSYSLLVAILGAFYTGSMFLIGSFFLPVTTDRNQLMVSASMALVLVFTFQPLRRWLERITDQVFFKEKYDSEDLLGDLSRTMASTLDLPKMAGGVLKELLGQMKVSRGVIILTKDHTISNLEFAGYQEKPQFKVAQVKELMTASQSSLVFDELSEDKIKDLMRRLNLSFCSLLKVKERKVGLLALEEKSSGDIYSNQDIEVLGILTPQLAVAVQNAQAYDEIKRFSITLKEEVDRATKQLKKTNVKLKEVSALKDEFVSVASHELRSPMTNIKGFISMILDGDTGKISAKTKEFLEDAYKSNDRMIRLINNMLNVSRIESGRLIISLADIQIEEAIKEVVRTYQLEAKEHGLELRYFKPEKKLSKVRVDPDRIREVISNLVGNAIKFTSHGHIWLKSYEENGMLTVTVEDTGAGISAEDQKSFLKSFLKWE